MSVYNARHFLDLACELSLRDPLTAFVHACQAYVLATDPQTRAAAVALVEAL